MIFFCSLNTKQDILKNDDDFYYQAPKMSKKHHESIITVVHIICIFVQNAVHYATEFEYAEV